MSRCGSLISTLAVASVAAYVSYVSFIVLSFFYPTLSIPFLHTTVPKDTPFHTPYYSASQRFDLSVYLCQGNKLDQEYVFRNKDICGTEPVWHVPSLKISDVFSQEEKNITLPKFTRENGTMVAHVFVVAEGKSPDPTSSKKDSLVLHAATYLTRYVRLAPSNSTRNLLSTSDTPLTDSDGENIERARENDAETPIVAHWKPFLHVELVDDRNAYPHKMVPDDLPLRFVNVEGSPYLPILHINELGIQRKNMLPIVGNNEKQPHVPLKITLKSVHLGMYRVGRTFDESLKLMSQPNSAMHVSEKEIDNLRQMFFETEPSLLGVTILASVLHMLFAFLAFKSDVSHWRKKETMEGVSKTSVMLGALGQVIAVFFLWDKRKETSSLVVGGAFAAAAVDLWKVFRMITHPPATVAEKNTANIDSKATRYIIGASIVSISGYAIWSLLYKEHTGYWSWGVDAAMWSVYVLGFLNMTPQLFLNYRLKSVMAMPLQAFFFKAINTFVDDLFAFVIPMPTLTRLSVFRDDFIFIILCIQWWIYPARRAEPSSKVSKGFAEGSSTAIKSSKVRGRRGDTADSKRTSEYGERRESLKGL